MSIQVYNDNESDHTDENLTSFIKKLDHSKKNSMYFHFLINLIYKQ